MNHINNNSEEKPEQDNYIIKNDERYEIIRKRLDSEISVSFPNSDLPCKTCIFSKRLFTGEVLSSEDYDAGSCAAFEIKPASVYFNGEPCPEYKTLPETSITDLK